MDYHVCIPEIRKSIRMHLDDTTYSKNISVIERVLFLPTEIFTCTNSRQVVLVSGNNISQQILKYQISWVLVRPQRERRQHLFIQKGDKCHAKHH